MIGYEQLTDYNTVAMRKLLWHSVIGVFTKVLQSLLLLVNPDLFRSFAPGFSSGDSISMCLKSGKRTLIYIEREILKKKTQTTMVWGSFIQI